MAMIVNAINVYLVNHQKSKLLICNYLNIINNNMINKLNKTKFVFTVMDHTVHA